MQSDDLSSYSTVAPYITIWYLLNQTLNFLFYIIQLVNFLNLFISIEDLN